MSGREVIPLEEGGEVPSSSSSGNSFVLSTLRWLNTVCVWILAFIVIALLIQVQLISRELKEQQNTVDGLLDQIQNQQAGQIQELNEKVDQEHSLTLYQMAGTFTLLTGLLTMFHMSSHLRSFNEPFVQRKIITILWMSPIYATTSFLSLVFPVADGYLAVIRDFYEAYVIYTFLSFLIAVLGRGNRDVAIDVLARHADHLDKPTRCLNRCYSHPPELNDKAKASAVLMECQILCMQFVFIRPLTSIVSFVSTTLIESHQNEDAVEDDSWAYFKSPSFYCAMVTNVSVFLAFTGLLKFYHAVRDDLLWCQPLSKFMAIKSIVFLTFWQGLLIAIFVNLRSGQWSSDGGVTTTDDTTATDMTDEGSTRLLGEDSGKTPHEQAAEIQNILICLEMLFFSIAHWCVFPSEEWEPGYRPKQYAKPGIGLKDFASDMRFIMSSSRNGSNVGEPARQPDEEVGGDSALEPHVEESYQAKLQ